MINPKLTRIPLLFNLALLIAHFETAYIKLFHQIKQYVGWLAAFCMMIRLLSYHLVIRCDYDTLVTQKYCTL